MQELQPQLAELLRTCIHPPSLRLRVVHVKFVDVSCDRVDTSHNDADPLLQSVDSAYLYATKLILTDGDLMIQSLLHRKLSTLGDVAGVLVGDLLEIKSFQIKKSSKVTQRGHTLYLAIQDCHLLKEGRLSQYTRTENNQRGKRSRSATESTENNTIVLDRETGEEEMFYSADELIERSPKRVKRISPAASKDTIRESGRLSKSLLDKTASKSPKRVSFTNPTSSSVARSPSAHDNIPMKQVNSVEDINVAPSPRDTLRKGTDLQDFSHRESDDDAEFFESAQTSLDVIRQRRQALRNLDVNITSNASSTTYETHTESKISDTVLMEQPRPTEIDKAPSQTVDRVMFQAPPPFHTLRSLRSPAPNKPLPSKSYTLTTLGFVTWTGSTLIHRPGSPFPPKRHLKIVDPSLSSSRQSLQDEASSSLPPKNEDLPRFKSQNSFQEAVTLAVYLDAARFKPAPGTLALLRGVVMQRLANGDVILNVYARLKEVRFNDGIGSGEMKKDSHAEGENSSGHDQQDHSQGNHWFITDHSRIRALGYGSRLDYYLEWWRNRDA